MTEKQLAGNQRRRLRTMRRQLLEMSAQWDGIDQFNMGQLEDLANQVESVATEMVADEAAAGECDG